MTLEECIEYFENEAETSDSLMVPYEARKKYSDECKQMSDWLKELQKWRALRDSINMLCVVDCEYPMYRESKTMCDACPIGTVKEYFEEIFGEEVNADENIHS